MRLIAKLLNEFLGEIREIKAIFIRHFFCAQTSQLKDRKPWQSLINQNT